MADGEHQGRFIVFEGIEGSGKSTQAKLLFDALQKEGVKCFLTKEPWPMSKIERLIREELANRKDPIDNRTLQLLMIACRSDHVVKEILPMLEEGYTIICDRWIFSTIAYGDAFSAKGLDADLEYFVRANSPFPMPDAVFYFDVTPEVGYERVVQRKGKEERFDEVALISAMRDSYHKVSRLYPNIWHVINGAQPVEAVAADVIKLWKELQQRNWKRDSSGNRRMNKG